ncbi:MAG TPA: outer membrane protein assembly factor BamB [Usitatibacter sp.]|jgi:outer membrane protein assembly factor BamB|nr:outer membrane protein assembly factor BamB [Usitatibacter sp.]
MRKQAAFAVATLLLAAGCSSYNPLVAVGIVTEPPNPPTPLQPIKATVTPKAAWSTSVGKSLGFRLVPVVRDGHVYAISADGSLTILDEANGRVTANLPTKEKFSGGLGFGDGRLYAGTMKGEVVALDTAGKVQWKGHVAGEVIAPPAASRDVVVVRTSDGRIFGLAAADGKRVWVFQRPSPSLLLRTEAGVLAEGRDVVAGYPNGKLVALDVEDGKLTWEATVATPRGATELERIADVAGLPVVDGNMVCAAAFQGKLSCFDIQTRNVVWSRDFSSSRALVTDAKNIYAVDDTGRVHALDKKAGASVWTQDKLKFRRLTSPAVVNGYVVVGDGFGYLHVLAPEDGSIVGRLATDGSAVLDLVPVKDGVVVQTEKGTVALVRW